MSNAIFSGVLQTYGTSGAAFAARTAVTVGITTRVTIPQGWQLVETDAHVSVQFTADAGSNYVTFLAASGKAIIWSDGLSWSWLGDGTGGTGTRSEMLGAEG